MVKNQSPLMEDYSGTPISFCNLLCEENASRFNQKQHPSNPCFFLEENEDEFIQKLIQKETKFGFSGDFFAAGNRRSWLNSARLETIEWILTNQAIFGFQPRTAYLAVNYFDRFLSKRFIDEEYLWAVRLLSVACLSLAAKMEEIEVPTLPELALKEYYFENKVIQKMELLVLSTLEWKMDSITPFHYIDYFITKFHGESSNRNLISRVLELIMNMAREINLTVYRPSIITITAVLSAIYGELTREIVEMKMGMISSCNFLEIGHVLSCYNQMKEIEMGKIMTPSLEVFQSLSNDSSGSKRKFPYSESDENWKMASAAVLSEFDFFCSS